MKAKNKLVLTAGIIIYIILTVMIVEVLVQRQVKASNEYREETLAMIIKAKEGIIELKKTQLYGLLDTASMRNGEFLVIDGLKFQLYVSLTLLMCLSLYFFYFRKSDL